MAFKCQVNWQLWITIMCKILRPDTTVFTASTTQQVNALIIKQIHQFILLHNVELHPSSSKPLITYDNRLTVWLAGSLENHPCSLWYHCICRSYETGRMNRQQQIMWRDFLLVTFSLADPAIHLFDLLIVPLISSVFLLYQTEKLKKI